MQKQHQCNFHSKSLFLDNYLKAYSIGEAWLLSLKAVIAHGILIDDNKKPIMEVVPLCIEIIHPTLPDRIIDRYGDSNYLQFLSKNFGDLSPILNWGYSYAQRLYSFKNTNQIEHVIKKLANNPFSRSATISLLDKEEDHMHIPCLTTLDFKIRNDILIINAMFRSQDVGNKIYGDAIEILKIGYNIIQTVPARKIILILTIASANIYLDDIERVRSIINAIEKDT